MLEATGLPEDVLAQKLAEVAGLPFLPAEEVVPLAETAPLLRWQELLRLLVLPLRYEDGVWQVAIADPTDGRMRRRVTRRLGGQPRFAVASPSVLVAAILGSSGAPLDAAQGASRVAHADCGSPLDEGRRAMRELAALGDVAPEVADPDQETGCRVGSPIVLVVDALIQQAILDSTSVAYVEAGSLHVHVRYRIDGRLHQVMTLPGYIAAPLLNRLDVVSGVTPGNRSTATLGCWHMRFNSRPYNLVVAGVPTRLGRDVAIHVYPDVAYLPLGAAGMLPEDEARLVSLLEQPRGLFVIAGPAHSGRTRLLYALAARVASARRHVTVVDTVPRYPLAGVTELLCPDPGALVERMQGALRLRTDVLVLRDAPTPESLRLAVEASAEGVAVFLRVPGACAADAIARLRRRLGDADLLAGALTAAIGCRLADLACCECGGSGRTPEGKECRHCRGTGVRGQVGLCEVLAASDAVRAAVAAGARAAAVGEVAIAAGMRPLDGLALSATDAPRPPRI